MTPSNYPDHILKQADDMAVKAAVKLFPLVEQFSYIQEKAQIIRNTLSLPELLIVREQNQKLKADKLIFLGGLKGAMLGLSFHPHDVPLNGHLISDASKEKLQTINDLIKQYETQSGTN